MIRFNKSILISSSISLALMLSSASVVYAGYGEAGSATFCSNEKPSKPWLYAVTNSGRDQASLYVDKSDRANSWTVAYGVQSGRYIYGLTNFGRGDERIITVNHLPAGTYYFAIRGNNGCMPGPFSGEMSVRIGGGARLASNYVAPVQTYVPPTNPRTITPVITPRTTVAPTVPQVTQPKAVVPAPKVTPPAPKIGFWQSITNFFNGLFGGK